MDGPQSLGLGGGVHGLLDMDFIIRLAEQMAPMGIFPAEVGAMSGIQFVNLGEVLAGIEARKKKLEDIPKLAKQMGVLALNEIHPLTHKKSGNWDSSIHAEVSEVGSYKYELWVGSKGAFSGSGYNYGKRQEDLYHPIDIGAHKAQPAMVDLWNEKMKGIVTANAAGMSDFAELDVGQW